MQFLHVSLSFLNNFCKLYATCVSLSLFALLILAASTVRNLARFGAWKIVHCFANVHPA